MLVADWNGFTATYTSNRWMAGSNQRYKGHVTAYQTINMRMGSSLFSPIPNRATKSLGQL